MLWPQMAVGPNLAMPLSDRSISLGKVKFSVIIVYYQSIYDVFTRLYSGHLYSNGV
jgi:hypothetical protein